MTRVVVIGGGVGGLVAAAELAHHGMNVTLVERAASIGGKMRTVDLGGGPIDVGPTVLTMRWVMDQIFSDLGTSLEDHLDLVPCSLLARHAWEDGTEFDLFADRQRSADAIAEAFGPGEARGYLDFCRHAETIYRVCEGAFILAERPAPTALLEGFGLRGVSRFLQIDAMRSVARALGTFFEDPRLRQLFGRYSTYYGSSPFLAPATLNLIAHVEQEGVWLVRGGMYRVAAALERLASVSGAKVLCGAQVDQIVAERGAVRAVRLEDGRELEADVVVSNASVEALAAGAFGDAARRVVRPVKRRSFSAFTIAMEAQTAGFSLAPHNVFFSSDSRREFEQLRGGEIPDEPTVYVRAQDRFEQGSHVTGPSPSMGEAGDVAERLFCIVNAPANGDVRSPWKAEEKEACLNQAMNVMRRSGLEIAPLPDRLSMETPADFERMFPHTGGALYGPATHGFTAALQRPPASTKLRGLYLTGGSAHPGAGVPMVALSGRLAAAAILRDHASMTLSRPTAIVGGTSTHSATTAASA